MLDSGNGAILACMLRYVLATIPLCSLLAWMQTSETLLLTLDPLVHNGSLALALSFAAGSAFCVVASKQRPFVLQPKVFIGASLAASALGFASLALPFDGAHIACSCAQTALMALLVVPTGGALAPLPRRVVALLVGVAGAGAVAIAFALQLRAPVGACALPARSRLGWDCASSQEASSPNLKATKRPAKTKGGRAKATQARSSPCSASAHAPPPCSREWRWLPTS